jgi:hypothetical protein
MTRLLLPLYIPPKLVQRALLAKIADIHSRAAGGIGSRGAHYDKPNHQDNAQYSIQGQDDAHDGLSVSRDMNSGTNDRDKSNGNAELGEEGIMLLQVARKLLDAGDMEQVQVNLCMSKRGGWGGREREEREKGRGRGGGRERECARTEDRLSPPFLPPSPLTLSHRPCACLRRRSWQLSRTIR